MEASEKMELEVTVGDGKYTVRVMADGRMHALRNGEPWRDLNGDGLIYALAAEIENTMQLLDEAAVDFVGSPLELQDESPTPAMLVKHLGTLLCNAFFDAGIKDHPVPITAGWIMQTLQQQSAEIERLGKTINDGDYACLRELALIREASGHGNKPMLSELAGLVAKDYAELATLREVVGRLVETGSGVMEYVGVECRPDHHGLCQEHGLGQVERDGKWVPECEVALHRDALAAASAALESEGDHA